MLIKPFVLAWEKHFTLPVKVALFLVLSYRAVELERKIGEQI
jgi:hypothetical protein